MPSRNNAWWKRREPDRSKRVAYGCTISEGNIIQSEKRTRGKQIDFAALNSKGLIKQGKTQKTQKQSKKAVKEQTAQEPARRRHRIRLSKQQQAAPVAVPKASAFDNLPLAASILEHFAILGGAFVPKTITRYRDQFVMPESLVYFSSYQFPSSIRYMSNKFNLHSVELLEFTLEEAPLIPFCQENQDYYFMMDAHNDAYVVTTITEAQKGKDFNVWILEDTTEGWKQSGPFMFSDVVRSLQVDPNPDFSDSDSASEASLGSAQ